MIVTLGNESSISTFADATVTFSAGAKTVKLRIFSSFTDRLYPFGSLSVTKPFSATGFRIPTASVSPFSEE